MRRTRSLPSPPGLLAAGLFCALAAAAPAEKARTDGPGSKAPTKAARNPEANPAPTYKSPQCVAFSHDGRWACVTCRTASSVAILDAEAGKVAAEVRVGARPTGVACHPRQPLALVAVTGEHRLAVVDLKARKVVARIPVGLEPTGVAVGPAGKRAYAANYLGGDVSVIDLHARKEAARIPVGRTPTYLAVTPDGKRLLVNHLLAEGPATDPDLTTRVTVVDVAAGKVLARRRSPGTMLLNQGICVSPDGKLAFSVHSRPNFNITPSQLNQGWVHTNALSILPLGGEAGEGGEVVTVLLDNCSSGAANPHGVAVSPDGRSLYVAHRGIHRVSVVDLPKLRRLIDRASDTQRARLHVDLGFLWETGEVVRRADCGGLGPCGVAVRPGEGTVWVANRFSDDVGVLDGRTGRLLRTIGLGGPGKMTRVRRGEFLFHDARHCFQQWVSCTSCHPRTRADGVNWDLLNDGQTNPKNAKSLVGSHETPPAMAMGVRASMEVAVEKGFVFIQFVQPRRDELEAVGAYLRSVGHIPSPLHRDGEGRPDAAARRGRKAFEKAACDTCHPAPLYTDLRSYDVGTRTGRELPGNKDREFDTPSLLELYRTGPYLHDGRAATLMDVLTTHNRDDRHGTTSTLSKKELADLVAFLESL